MKKYLYRFIPNRFEYLINIKKIEFKSKNLKTDYIINLIHELLIKYFFSDDIDNLKINLWSLILRKKYGMNYNYYIEYLIENNYITLISDYYVNKKSKTYKLNYKDLKNLKRVKIYDNILLKKYNKNFILKNIDEYSNNSIDVNVKKKLINDLYKVKIDYDNSIKYLNKLKKNNKIDENKYYKNLLSINSIKDGHLFFKFDSYGRFHTNFTILKKEIRQNFLKIDNMDLCELDIKNSQPFFLSILMKKYMKDWKEFDDVERYFFVVNDGIIYDDIIENIKNIKNKKEAKIFMYKILFGDNNLYKKNSNYFKKMYPNVYFFIENYKKNKGNYKSMSHDLQQIESDFIFNDIIKNLMKINKNINVLTIHDSIMFPCKYLNKINDLFNTKLDIMKK